MLAGAMGFTDPALYDDDETVIRTALAGPHPALRGMTLKGLRTSGWQRLSLPTPAVPFADGRFPTPSGRVELYSESMHASGLDPLPAYVEEDCSPVRQGGQTGGYPLYLMTPGAHRFVNSSFAGLPELAAKEGVPTLHMNPADGLPRGIEDGDAVAAFNEKGSCRLTARLSDAVRPGVTATTTVWWNKRSPGGRNANALIADTLTDMGDGPIFYSAAIEVEKRGSETEDDQGKLAARSPSGLEAVRQATHADSEGVLTTVT